MVNGLGFRVQGFSGFQDLGFMGEGAGCTKEILGPSAQYVPYDYPEPYTLRF